MKVKIAILAVIFFCIAIYAFSASEVRNLIIKPSVIAPGQRVTLTFEYRSTGGYGTAYYAMFSDVCSGKSWCICHCICRGICSCICWCICRY